MGQITELQKRVWTNKLDKGFNTTNVDREFNYTYAELSEAYDSWRKERGDVGEELADTAIFVMALAEMLGVDLETEIMTKIAKNEAREYIEVTGHHIKKETK